MLHLKRTQLAGLLPQVQVGLEAFLAKPDSGTMDFRDCAQVINPFIVTTKIDHCVEPTALSTYRFCPSSLLIAEMHSKYKHNEDLQRCS